MTNPPSLEKHFESPIHQARYDRLSKRHFGKLHMIDWGVLRKFNLAKDVERFINVEAW